MISYKEWASLDRNLKLRSPSILSVLAWRRIYRDINMEFWGVKFFEHDPFP